MSSIIADAGADYMELHQLIVSERLGGSSRQHCFKVTILDDNAPENTEMLTVSLLGESFPQVQIDPPVATIKILDDDRKHSSC